MTNPRSFPWRAPDRTAYELVIAEILLQRTGAEHVAGVYQRFLCRYPSWSTIVAARESELEATLKPLGLWRRRARSLKAIAREMVRRQGEFPRSRGELESIPAVGQYVANAVLLLVHKQREPLLDSNMARLLERFFGPRSKADIRYDEYLQTLSRAVLSDGDARSTNWAILDLAAVVCRPRQPRCELCPLAERCRYFLGRSIPSPKDRRNSSGDSKGGIYGATQGRKTERVEN